MGNNAAAWTNETVKPDSSPQSWNVDIFVQVVKDLAPHVNWKEVVRELDHTGLVVANKASLRLIVQALHRGIQEEFPIEHVYRLWNNTEAQVCTSLLVRGRNMYFRETFEFCVLLLFYYYY